MEAFKPQLELPDVKFLWYFIDDGTRFHMHKHLATDPEGLAKQLEGYELTEYGYGPTRVIPYFKKSI